MKRILFVCTGNTCRSPMAEALLRHMGEQAGLSIEVQSAGIMTVDGLSVSEQTLQALQSRGITYSGRSQAIHKGLLEWADLVLTMTRDHKQVLMKHYPEGIEKMYILNEYGSDDADKQALRKQLDQIHTEMTIAQQEQRPQSELDRLVREEQCIREKLDDTGEPADIQDPFGGDFEDYQICAEELESNLRRVLERLKKEEGQG